MAKDLQGWQLVWNDEFNYEGLPDPSKWDYEVGYMRNNEAQLYTKANKLNAYVSNGALKITARKNETSIADDEARSWDPAKARYTSASMITFNKASWTYGRIEIRAKLPGGSGSWPAMWLLGQNADGKRWPAWGEIDMMEYYGRTPGKIFSNLHFPDPETGDHESSSGNTYVRTAESDFHVYVMEWNSSQITFSVDGKDYLSFNIDKAGSEDDNPFRKPHYLMLNFALGGKSGGKIDDAGLPRSMEIDYVRVYQKK